MQGKRSIAVSVHVAVAEIVRHKQNAEDDRSEEKKEGAKSKEDSGRWNDVATSCGPKCIGESRGQ